MQPPISFLSELQEKMKARKLELEKDNICFREFDVTQNKFVMINKEEREKKLKLFEIELTEFEQKKKQR